MESMTAATDAFVKAADYLTESDQAAVTALRQAAAALDEKMNASLLANWYKIYSDLSAKGVQEEQHEEKDEQEQFLEGLGI
jgi:hypothetical protein